MACFIYRDSSTKYLQIKNEKIDWSLVATVLGVMFNICVIIMLSIYYRRSKTLHCFKIA